MPDPDDYLDSLRQRVLQTIADNAVDLDMRPQAGPPGPRAPQRQSCEGVATFSAIGPHQAPNNSAIFIHEKPADGTVAIAGEKTFGLGKPELREGAAEQIQITPHGLDGLLKSTGGPSPPYSVGDYGDKNIRNAPGTRFDIYRFNTLKGAQAFGTPTVPTTITIPPGARCPPGFKPD